jgi:hypothetical protein
MAAAQRVVKATAANADVFPNITACAPVEGYDDLGTALFGEAGLVAPAVGVHPQVLSDGQMRQVGGGEKQRHSQSVRALHELSAASNVSAMVQPGTNVVSGTLSGPGARTPFVADEMGSINLLTTGCPKVSVPACRTGEARVWGAWIMYMYVCVCVCAPKNRRRCCRLHVTCTRPPRLQVWTCLTLQRGQIAPQLGDGPCWRLEMDGVKPTKVGFGAGCTIPHPLKLVWHVLCTRSTRVGLSSACADCRSCSVPGAWLSPCPTMTAPSESTPRCPLGATCAWGSSFAAQELMMARASSEHAHALRALTPCGCQLQACTLSACMYTQSLMKLCLRVPL